MTALDRKLVRDLLRLRGGQVASVALVVACSAYQPSPVNRPVVSQSVVWTGIVQ